MLAPPPLPARLFRALVLAIVRVFYPTRSVRGAVAPAGPVIVVANHPNGLLDPLVLWVALGHPLAFLAKSTLFAGPLRAAMLGFGAIPVYRAGEGDTRRNEETFDRAREVLAAGGWLALFPEGKSHDGTELAPLKSGAARIALTADPRTRVVPVGLCYNDKAVFRSGVSVTVGAPIALEALRARHAEDPRGAVGALTDAIAEGLSDVLLEAEDEELWRGFRAVAGWLAADADPGARDATARRLADAWRRLGVTDPDARERVAERARRLARTLAALGVRDPLALEADLPSAARLAARAAPLVLLVPLALVGALLSWPAYRAIRPVATRLAAGHADVVSTYKLLLGAAVLPAYWIAEALLVGRALDATIGVVTLAIAPLSGFVALRWDERAEARREATHALWSRLTRARLAQYAREERAALAAEVRTVAALDDRAATRAR